MTANADLRGDDSSSGGNLLEVARLDLILICRRIFGPSRSLVATDVYPH